MADLYTTTVKLPATIRNHLQRRREETGITMADQLRLALELWLTQSPNNVAGVVTTALAKDEALQTLQAQLIELSATVRRLNALGMRERRLRKPRTLKPRAAVQQLAPADAERKELHDNKNTAA
jgi:hypothetical protein